MLKSSDRSEKNLCVDSGKIICSEFPSTFGNSWLITDKFHKELGIQTCNSKVGVRDVKSVAIFGNYFFSTIQKK